MGCHKGWSFLKTTRWREIHASVLNYSRISWNGGYHSLLIVSVLTLIYNILQPNLDPEDSNVPFETKALHFFVLFTYRQVTKPNWVNLIDFGQNVKVLKTTKSLLWYQHTAVFLLIITECILSYWIWADFIVIPEGHSGIVVWQA